MQEPELLRADEGPRRAGHQPDRPPGRHARTPAPRPTSCIVDCVGVTETELTDTQPLEQTADRSPLGQAAASRSPSAVIDRRRRSRRSPAGLARLDRQLGEPTAKRSAEISRRHDAAGDRRADSSTRSTRTARSTPPADAGLTAGRRADTRADRAGRTSDLLARQAVAPLASQPRSCGEASLEIKQRFEQTIDSISKDEVLEAGYSADATRPGAERRSPRSEQFIEEHKDEITALQVLYSRPYAQRLRFADVKALAEAISAPPRNWTPDTLWRAYETLDQSKVRGIGHTRARPTWSPWSASRIGPGRTSSFPTRSRSTSASRPGWPSRRSTGRTFTAEQRHVAGGHPRPRRVRACGSSRTTSSIRLSPSGEGLGGCMRCSVQSWPQLIGGAE